MKKIFFLIAFILLISHKPAFAVPVGATCTSTPGGSTCDAGLSCAGTTPGVPGNGICIDQRISPRNATTIYMSPKYTPNDDGGGPLDAAFGYPAKAIMPANLGGGGGFTAAVQSIASLYDNKPAETALAIRQLKMALRLPVKEAYAQSASGFGFQALSPILGIWSLMRNIALAGFVVIFVVVGIMVMLRQKIDPRTVITIQQAIPKIAISLVLVIFSYAICALFVDATMFISRLGLTVLQSAGYIAQGNNTFEYDPPAQGAVAGDGLNPTENFNALLNNNIFMLFDGLYNVDNLINGMTSLGISGPTAPPGTFNTLDSMLHLNIGTGNGILGVVLWIAVFVALLRTFFMLLSSYLMVTLKIIFSPFSFLMMGIPGSEQGFESWARGMFRHLLVFPVTFLFLCLAAIFASSSNDTLWTNQVGDLGHNNYWNVGQGTGSNPLGVFPVGAERNSTPPVSYWAPPALGNWAGAVGPMLAFGIILTIPKVADMVREAVTPKSRPGAGEGYAGQAFKEAANRVPIVGGLIGR